MSPYRYILFDLDGTVTDPALGITNSVMHALKKFGIAIPPRHELYRFIGPPLAHSFETFYGLSAEDAQLAVAYYREYYHDNGIYENAVYDGFEDLLKRLQENGRTVLLATSKPEVYARRILDHFGLTRYFAYIAGSELDGTRVDKAEVIAYALENAGRPEVTRAVMIGDREHDIIGARKCGLKSVGVLFGYGSREELENAGATHIAETVEDISRLL